MCYGNIVSYKDSLEAYTYRHILQLVITVRIWNESSHDRAFHYLYIHVDKNFWKFVAYPFCFINSSSTPGSINQKHILALKWRHNGRDGVSNHQHHDCLLNRLFRRRSKKTSKLRVTGLCAENSPVTGEFPAQMASNAENVSIWWRHHVLIIHAPNYLFPLSIMTKILWL